MALYRFSAKVIGRSSGSSAVAAAAYRHGAKMTIEHDGRLADYSRKEAVHSGGIELPDDAPKWAAERYGGKLTQASSNLWNDVEALEAKSNRHATAQLAREYLLVLPVELSADQNEAVIRQYVKDNIASRGMIADWSFHDVEGNPHVHVMATMRGLAEDGFGNKVVDWNSRSLINDLRREWADSVNMGLERAGCEERVDHRSYKEQGLEIEPGIHLGPVVSKLAEQGVELDQLKTLNAIQERNAEFLRNNPEYFLRLVTANRAVFTEDDLAREIHKRVDDAAFGPLFEKLRNSDELVKVGVRRWGAGKEDQKPLLTTRSQLAMEQGLLDRAGEMSRELAPGAASFPEHEIKDEQLSEEQRLAVNAMVAPNRLSIVTGRAGTGKSRAVAEAKRIWEERGYEVFGTALAGKAVDELTKASGIEGRTISSWEARMQADGFTNSDRFVMIMDEAGMVGSRQMDRFSRRIEAAGGKLVLIGDPQQAQAIASGAALKAISERVGDATISTIRRQHDPEHREIAMGMATSSKTAKEALLLLDQRGEISTFESTDLAIEKIAADYAASADGEASQLALAYTNADVQSLNGSIRGAMIEAGMVSREGIEVQGARGPMALAVGDRVITTSSMSEHDLSKSSFGTIEALTPHEAQIRMDASEGVVTFKADQLRQLDHAYAVTVHKSQGATVDQSFILPHPLMDRQLAYVAITRHRSDVQVYAGEDRFKTTEDLIKTLSKTKLQTFSAREDLDKAALPGFGIDARLPYQDRRDVTPTMPRGAEASVFTDPHLHEVSERGMGLMAVGTAPNTPKPDLIRGEGNAARLMTPALYIDDAVAKQSVFSAEDISEAVMADTADPETYLHAFSQAMTDARLVTLAEIGPGQVERLYSTAARVREEIESTDRAVKLATTHFHAINTAAIEGQVKALEKPLSDEQQTAVINALSRQCLSAVVGVAGAGKSYTMGAVKELAERQDFTVVGAALAGKAADELEQGSGIESRTLASWFHQFDRGQGLEPGTVFVLDEAGMVDGASMNRLLKQVEADKAMLVLVGDPEQIQPIGPIGAMRAIVDRIGYSELTEVRRQQEPWMADATLSLSLGGEDAEEAIAAYQKAGMIEHLGDRDAALDAAAAHYAGLQDVDKVMLTHRRADVDALNAAYIKGQGAGRVEQMFTAEQREIGVALNDRIMLTKNDRALGVKNGMVGTVTSVDEQGFTLRVGPNGPLKDGSIAQDVRIDAAAFPNFAHGFATTINKSQGMSLDHTVVYADRSLNKHLSYVAYSRHKQDMKVFTPFITPTKGLGELKRMAVKIDHQTLAIDHIGDAKEAFAEVMSKAQTDDLNRDLKHSDVKAAMVAARQDPVQHEVAQARRLHGVSQSLVSDLAGVLLHGGLNLLTLNDRHTGAMMGLFHRANRVINQTEQTARALNATLNIARRDPVQSAVNEQMARMKQDLTTRLAQSEIGLGKQMDASRHSNLSAQIDWLLHPSKLNAEQQNAANTLASALRRQEDVAINALKDIGEAGYDINSLGHWDRRIAFDLADERLSKAGAPTILDQRMAERMVEALGIKKTNSGAPAHALEHDEDAATQIMQRLDQMRAALYQHRQFEPITSSETAKATISDEQINAAFDKNPMLDNDALRAKVNLGEAKAIKQAFPHLNARQTEAMAQRILEDGILVKNPRAYKAAPHIQKRVAERMGIDKSISELTPREAHNALTALEQKHGTDGLKLLIETGNASIKGAFGIQPAYGPPSLVKKEINKVAQTAMKHKQITKALATIVKKLAGRTMAITQ